MSRYQITSSAGVALGIYEAATPAEALDAMARDAGYASQADAVANGIAPFDGTVTETAHVVRDYETGDDLAGSPTAELVRESLSREPTGAVGAYLAGGEWHWLDDGDPAPCGSVNCRTVYVAEVAS